LSAVQWISEPTGLVAAHLVAHVVWIGALLSVARLIARAPWMADPAEVGTLARGVYSRLAVPAFLVSFGAGLGRILVTPQAYAHLPWLHVKLALALVVIVLHHVIGARAARVAAGNPRAGKGATALGALVLLFAGGAVLLGVAKSLPR
jgi:putative membrane protein